MNCKFKPLVCCEQVLVSVRYQDYSCSFMYNKQVVATIFIRRDQQMTFLDIVPICGNNKWTGVHTSTQFARTFHVSTFKLTYSSLIVCRILKRNVIYCKESYKGLWLNPHRRRYILQWAKQNLNQRQVVFSDESRFNVSNADDICWNFHC